MLQYYSVTYSENRNYKWSDILRSRIIVQNFFQGNLTGDLEFLQIQLIPLPKKVFPNPFNPNMSHSFLWLQQYGAPSHFRVLLSILNFKYSKTLLPNIRQRLEWPAKSPELIPLDYFLCRRDPENKLSQTKRQKREPLLHRCTKTSEMIFITHIYNT